MQVRPAGIVVPEIVRESGLYRSILAPCEELVRQVQGQPIADALASHLL